MPARSTRPTPRLLAAVLLTGALAAWAAGAAAAPSTARSHAAGDRTVPHDVTFIAMLIPHHQSAVELARVARNRATNGQVRRLAAQTAEEQRRQVRQLLAWLDRHDAAPMPPPAPVRETERQDLALLRAAKGIEVDHMFLMMTRPHHVQAVPEPDDELLHGRNPSRQIARTTRDDQSREIALMNDLLAALHPMPSSGRRSLPEATVQVGRTGSAGPGGGGSR